MSYRLTTTTNITNVGASLDVFEFDTYDELQEHMQEQARHMERDEEELYYYNSKIEELN